MTNGSEDRIDLRGDGRIILYKRAGSKDAVWQARIRVPNSTGYKRVTTKTSRQREAERFALDLYEDLYLHVKSGGSIQSRTFKQVFEEWKKTVTTMGHRGAIEDNDRLHVSQGHPRAGEVLNASRVWHAVTPAKRFTTNYFFAMGSTDHAGVDEMTEYLKPVLAEDIFATVEIEKIIRTMDELPPELMLKSDGTAVLGMRAARGRKIPVVLTQSEVKRLLDATTSLKH